MRELANPLKRAAQYVRVSTEHQRYAIENQLVGLRTYAADHGLEIVRTYADEGISGLHFHKRVALKQLLKDVVSGDINFSTILVYDVSRWGRFQDTDESAHYEFLCRQSGVRVEYCGEPFENDGSAVSTLVKGMKRLMAAEYSRDLSSKVHRGQLRAAVQGFHATGPANFGFRRLVVGPDGKPGALMETGQRKALATDRVILVPGPLQEVKLVRWIFRARANGKTLPEIVHTLKQNRSPAAKRRNWATNTLGRLIENEIYVGNKVWNRQSAKLGAKRTLNPEEEWVRVEGVCKPIVSKKVFEQAQRPVAKRIRSTLTDDELLDGLRRLYAEEKRLTSNLIRDDKRIPCVQVYGKRFGSLLRAYQKIGFSPSYNLWNSHTGRTLHDIRLSTTRTAIEEIRRRGKSVALRPGKRVIAIEGITLLMFMVARCLSQKSGAKYWELVPPARTKLNLIVVARMDSECMEILDYFIIPRKKIRAKSFKIYEEIVSPLDRYRCKNLEPLYAMATYGRQSMTYDQWVRKAIEFTHSH